MKQTPNKSYVFLIYMVLTLATIIAFEPVRHNDFVYLDDPPYVTENPHIKAGITRESVVWAFTTPHVGMWHPLTSLSHMLDCQLFELNPLWHHLTSLFFHTANTLLLFWVLKRMTGAVWPSAFVAAVFALHPLTVESVAWVAERKNVLSGFFWILTIAAYIRYAKHPSIGRYLLVVLIFSMGLMAKPTVVTLPFALLLLDWWPLRRFHRRRQGRGEDLVETKSVETTCQKSPVWRLIGEKIPLFIFAAVLSVITYIAQQTFGTMTTTESLPLYFRVVNAMTSYLSYIVKIFYPTRLAVHYPYPTTLRIDAAMLLLIGISVLLVRWARRRPWLTVGLLWYIGTLVPVIGLVQVGRQAMADRYTYLPSIGIFIMIAWGATELFARWRYRKIVLGISTSIVLAGLLLCTRMQVQHWKNNFTLYEHALAVTKDNYIAHYNLGWLLLEKRQFDEAIMHFKETLRVRPQYLDARNNIGVAYLRQGKYDEAITCFNELLQHKPDYPNANKNLRIALRERGKIDKALKKQEKAPLF
jgi:hypothetical protein